MSRPKGPITYKNQELYQAFLAYKRRGKHVSNRQAVFALMREAGYKKPEIFYEYLHDRRRPKGDKRPVFARILRRPSDKLWPPREG